MRRLAAPVLSLSLVCLCLLPATASADGPLRLSPAGQARFPERSFVLTLPPGNAVRPNQVRVRENGKPVADLSVAPADAAAGRGFGVVLVIDASKSMHGRAIKNAMVAARAFAKRRSPGQQLGVVTFNEEPSTVLQPTTDGGAIRRALSAPPALGRETHVNDAVSAALSLLKRAKIAAGSVVVLSDGDDTGSRASAGAVAAQARKDGARVFSVGLRSDAFDPAPLRNLSAEAGGSYSEASDSRDLARIYDQLGSQLAREHLVQYRSLAGPRKHVYVKATVDGVPGFASAEYRSPAIRTAITPFEKYDFWASPAAVVLISLACSGLLTLAFLVSFVIRPGRRALRKRMAMFVSPAAKEEQVEKVRGAMLTDRVLLGADKSLERMKWWAAFKEELEIGRVELPAVHIIAFTGLGTVVAMWLALAISGSSVFAFVALAGVPLGVRFYLKRKLSRQRKLFTDQLADNLQVIGSALRAGHSFVGALTVSVDEAPEPTKTEFGRVLADEQLGVPLDEGLGVVARRMDNKDLNQVMLVATLQRETGGNTADVLDRVAETVRERGELRRLVASLTAQGRMSRWIVTALPVILLVVISLINPEYMKPLFETTAGKAMLVFASIMITIGSMLIKRIVTIKI